MNEHTIGPMTEDEEWCFAWGTGPRPLVCERHRFERCSTCHDIDDIPSHRTLYPYVSTETNLEALGIEFPGALELLDCYAPDWYSNHPEARLVKVERVTGSGTLGRIVLHAIAGKRQVWWKPELCVWVISTHGVSSKPRRDALPPCDVRRVVEIEGPTVDVARVFAIERQHLFDAEEHDLQAGSE